MDLVDNKKIMIDVRIKSSIQQLWQAWTDPILISKWFGSDPDGQVIKAELDVREGGTFTVTFQDADQTEHTCFGTYTEVEKFRKLAFTWNWKSEPGYESFATLELAAQDSFTLMMFEHAGIGAGSCHDYSIGWRSTFSKLQRVVEKDPT